MIIYLALMSTCKKDIMSMYIFVSNHVTCVSMAMKTNENC